MKFALFRGSFYYPNGGMDDFVGLFDSIEEAQGQFGNVGCEWAHIASVPGMKIVLEYSCDWKEWRAHQTEVVDDTVLRP